ncbi:MAG TPA: PadR family transcriptional regulator [Gemmatimonadaceae bacterium]|nr:PadR family transcriptional regulator [Gemmatimonadaceae bacterium]
MASRKPALSRIELLQGTLDLIILQTLRWGPRHGYDLLQFIRTTSRGVLDVDTGSLYPALHRLEAQGVVAAAWETSPKGQRVRMYRLTRAGQRRLAVEQTRWERLTGAIAAIAAPPAAGEA